MYLSMVLWSLGETLSKLGEYEQAAIHLRESLRLLQPTLDSLYKGYGIFSMAPVLHQRGIRRPPPVCWVRLNQKHRQICGN